MQNINGKNFQSTAELAKKMGVTPGRVRQLLSAGRVPGAIKVGAREYLIPEGAEDEIVLLPQGAPREFNFRRAGPNRKRPARKLRGNSLESA